MPKNKIEATDPRGKKIVCSKHCWYGHILGDHPERERRLKRMVNEIRRTIEKPNTIYSDRFSQTSEIYYRRERNEFIRIAVEFDEGI